MKKIYQTIMLTSLLMPLLADASLNAVGPNSKKNGFPLWYEDSNGLKLSLCLNQKGHCRPLKKVNRRLPVKFPRNFPSEAFWWAAETKVKASEGGTVNLLLTLEASFSNGVPRKGNRISSARIQITGTELPIGTYRITHPFGQETFNIWSTEDEIDFDKNVGVKKEDFTGALAGPIGPFLVWDPAVPPEAPKGHVGDPKVSHKVIGSPSGNNFLRIERIDVTHPREVGFTDMFKVSGKIHE